MRKRGNIFLIILNTAVFISLEIAALSMLRNSSTVQNFFVTKALQGVTGKVWGCTESISRYFSLSRENKKLTEDIFELNRRISLLERQLESAKLDSLSRKRLSMISDKFGFMPAPVVKNSLNKQHNYLILGKGSDDGVKPQTGVITNNGVIGIVDAVNRHYSYAISFLNAEFSVSARIGNDGAAGPMCWDGKHNDSAVLKEIPLQYKFEPGDTVYTSGYSSIFPPDIPLGVTGERKIVNGATYEVSVELFVDFSALRYVTLVTNKELAEIESLEEGKKIIGGKK